MSLVKMTATGGGAFELDAARVGAPRVGVCAAEDERFGNFGLIFIMSSCG